MWNKIHSLQKDKRAENWWNGVTWSEQESERLVLQRCCHSAWDSFRLLIYSVLSLSTPTSQGTFNSWISLLHLLALLIHSCIYSIITIKRKLLICLSRWKRQGARVSARTAGSQSFLNCTQYCRSEGSLSSLPIHRVLQDTSSLNEHSTILNFPGLPTLSRPAHHPKSKWRGVPKELEGTPVLLRVGLLVLRVIYFSNSLNLWWAWDGFLRKKI